MPVSSSTENALLIMDVVDVPCHHKSSPGSGNTQISQDVIWQFLIVKMRIGVGVPKLFEVSLLVQFPGAAKQEGVGEFVMVAVIVGVLVSVGVSVMVDVGVSVDVDVFVGVGLSVGPSNCPGPQAERNGIITISAMTAI
jgi:hypothetical protein